MQEMGKQVEGQEFEVEVTQSISTTVKVRAVDADAAIEKVNRADFPLPPRDEWSGHKDWSFRVYGEDGSVLAEQD